MASGHVNRIKDPMIEDAEELSCVRLKSEV